MCVLYCYKNVVEQPLNELQEYMLHFYVGIKRERAMMER